MYIYVGEAAMCCRVVMVRWGGGSSRGTVGPARVGSSHLCVLVLVLGKQTFPEVMHVVMTVGEGSVRVTAR